MDDYDFILIDCPPSLGLLTLNVLTAADAVIIPIQCEYYALEGISQLLNTIRLVQQNFNPGLAIDGVLLTMYDTRLNLARQVANDAKEYFGPRRLPHRDPAQRAAGRGAELRQADPPLRRAVGRSARAISRWRRSCLRRVDAGSAQGVQPVSEARRLGRGLEALLGPVSKEQAEKEGALRELPVTAIRPNPFQPRTRVDEEPLKELVGEHRGVGAAAADGGARRRVPATN